MTGMEKDVTFIMPAFNVEDYLVEAVASIQKLPQKDWKLIIVDDGSTDTTLEVASRLASADSRILVLRSHEGSGSAFQPRKRAIIEAQTEWVAPLDADDWIESNYLTGLFSLQKATDADIVYPTMWCPGSENEGLSIVAPSEMALINRAFTGRECVKYTLDGWRINCNGGLIRRKIYLEAFEKFDSSVSHTNADELLSRQLLSIAPEVAFSEVRYFYRTNYQSVTRRLSAKMFDFMINNPLLIAFAEDVYGRNSEEYLLAHRQNFHGYFEAMRLLNSYDFSEEDKLYGKKLMLKCRKAMDVDLLKGNVSPRYLALMSLGFGLSKFLLRAIDSVKGN